MEEKRIQVCKLCKVAWQWQHVGPTVTSWNNLLWCMACTWIWIDAVTVLIWSWDKVGWNATYALNFFLIKWNQARIISIVFLNLELLQFYCSLFIALPLPAFLTRNQRSNRQKFVLRNSMTYSERPAKFTRQFLG